MKTKQCKACGEALPLTAFGVEKNNRDGLRGKCKQCVQAQNTAYQRKKRQMKRLQNKGINLDAAKQAGFPYILGGIAW